MKRRTATTVTFVVGLLLSGAAHGQAIPNWSLAEICKADSYEDACVAFERNAYSRVSGLWPTIAPEITKACLDRMTAAGQPSYRILLECLEDEPFEARRLAREMGGVG